MDIFNGIISKIKKWIAGQDRKKLIENTAIVIIIGMIIIIAGSVFFRKGSGGQETAPVDSDRQAVQAPAADDGNNTAAADTLEKRLKTLLSQVQGVGKVDVMITYSSTTENVPAYDIRKRTGSTEERDGEGGTRSIAEEEYESSIAYEDSNSGKAPVILKKLEPQVKGVLIVAEGADSAEVRDRIYNAVSVVLDVPVHKVQVVQRKK